jgi:hypothetical protein
VSVNTFKKIKGAFVICDEEACAKPNMARVFLMGKVFLIRGKLFLFFITFMRNSAS